MTVPADHPASDQAPAPFELQAMAQAVNYYTWLAEYFRPQLNGVVVEHGSGTGLLSRPFFSPSPPLSPRRPDEYSGCRGVYSSHGALQEFRQRAPVVDRGSPAQAHIAQSPASPVL